MAETKKQLQAKITDDLNRLHKERQALEHHKPHSLRHHQAKLRLMRLHGQISTLEAALRKLIMGEHHGARRAVSYGMSKVGVCEHPAGSNRGPEIDAWTRAMGLGLTPGHDGYFWCGIFAGYCVVFEGHAHIPTPVRLASGTFIIEDARAHRNGLHAVPFDAAQKGDILVYWNGEHIGLCRGRPNSGIIPATEGNTSPATAGSQYNGGCVANKTRRQSDVTCVARPNY